MQFAQRKTRTMQTQANREAVYKQMEQQSKKDSVAREAQRKLHLQQQKEEYAGIHRETKKQKRMINIEIVSEVVDLIMDMADEVFDVSRDQPGKKMTKAQYREFSQIFIDGKKCSLRNIKKQIVDTEEGAEG